MRVRTDGEYAHREELIESAALLFECNKTKAVLKSCEHAKHDARRKEKAIEWASEELRPDQAAHLAQLLSTIHMKIEYEQPEGSIDL